MREQSVSLRIWDHAQFANQGIREEVAQNKRSQIRLRFEYGPRLTPTPGEQRALLKAMLRERFSALLTFFREVC